MCAKSEPLRVTTIAAPSLGALRSFSWNRRICCVDVHVVDFWQGWDKAPENFK